MDVSLLGQFAKKLKVAAQGAAWHEPVQERLGSWVLTLAYASPLFVTSHGGHAAMAANLAQLVRGGRPLAMIDVATCGAWLLSGKLVAKETTSKDWEQMGKLLAALGVSDALESALTPIGKTSPALPHYWFWINRAVTETSEATEAAEPS